MIKIIYELYVNDFTRKRNNIRYFNSYDELYGWIKENSYINPYHPTYPFFPFGEYTNAIQFHSQILNPFQQWRNDCTVWIRQIDSDKGIEFTDGNLTSGQKHKSKQMNELFDFWYKEIRKKEQFNFVD